MAKKYFRSDDDSFCLEKRDIIKQMKEEEINELKVFEAEICYNSDFFFCREHFEIGEKGQNSCGIICKHYIPNNGKNGRCKNYGYVYEKTDKSILIKI
jgi:hypothetical protein